MSKSRKLPVIHIDYFRETNCAHVMTPEKDFTQVPFGGSFPRDNQRKAKHICIGLYRNYNGKRHFVRFKYHDSGIK